MAINGTNIIWEEAENYLNSLIAEYVLIGLPGKLGLELTLLPLKRRIKSGERTDELYTEIMNCH